MATLEHADDSSLEMPREDIGLGYLNFICLVALEALIVIRVLYEVAKDNSGQFIRSGLESVECIVRAVARTVYQKIEGKPLRLLCFSYIKVDRCVKTLDARLSKYCAEKLQLLRAVLLEALHLGRHVISEAHENGVYETAKAYYVKYEPVAEDLSYKAWRSFLKLPMIPNAVNMAAPGIIFGAKKLNDVVALFKYHHFPLAAYIPLIPVEKLGRVVKVQAD